MSVLLLVFVLVFPFYYVADVHTCGVYGFGVFVAVCYATLLLVFMLFAFLTLFSLLLLLALLLFVVILYMAFMLLSVLLFVSFAMFMPYCCAVWSVLAFAAVVVDGVVGSCIVTIRFILLLLACVVVLLVLFMLVFGCITFAAVVAVVVVTI